jgi:hypothetical protein
MMAEGHRAAARSVIDGGEHDGTLMSVEKKAAAKRKRQLLTLPPPPAKRGRRGD